MRIGDQFSFSPARFALKNPTYRDILCSVKPTAEYALAEGEFVVGVDAENTIVAAAYKDGTRLIRNPDLRGGHIVLVEAPDGNFWYMNSPDCWLRLD